MKHLSSTAPTMQPINNNVVKTHILSGEDLDNLNSDAGKIIEAYIV